MAKALRNARTPKAPKTAAEDVRAAGAGDVHTDAAVSAPALVGSDGAGTGGDGAGGSGAVPGLTGDAATISGSTHNPQSEDREGGAGNAAGPAAVLLAKREKVFSTTPAADGPGPIVQLNSVTLEGVEMSPADFEKAFPRLSDAVKQWSLALTGEFRRPVIRIASKFEGFRRAGIPHSKAAVEHDADRFSPAQLEQLLGEPNLVVELI